MDKAALAEDVVIFIAFSMLTVAITWPLARNMRIFTAEIGCMDPILNARYMREVMDWFFLTRAWVFDANFFYPHPLALATTDPALGVALLAVPFRLFTSDYLLLVNLVILLSFPLTAWATYKLARELTGSRACGVLAGTAFGFCLYRFHQLDHVPILQMQWLPLALLFLHRLRDRQTIATGAGFVVFAFLNGIGSSNIGLYSAPVFPIVAMWLVLTTKPEARTRFMTYLVISGMAAIAALAPFYVPFLTVDMLWGIQRSVAEAQRGAAHIEQFLAAPRYNLIYGGPFGKLLGAESATFIGVTVLVLMSLGLFGRSSQRRERLGIADDSLIRKSIRTTAIVLRAVGLMGIVLMLTYLCIQSRWVTMAVCAAMLGHLLFLKFCAVPVDDDPTRSMAWLYFGIGLAYAVFALGPRIEFLGKDLGEGPWAYLSKMPGFGSIRTPSRFFFITSFSASLTAAMGAKWLMGRFSGLCSRSFAVAILLGAIIAESWGSPVPIRQMTPLSKAPETYGWLASQPEQGPILEIPLFHGEPDGRYRMFFANLHGRPTVDSESSFLPPVLSWVNRERFKDGSAAAFLERLNAAGLRFVVFHRTGLPGDEVNATARTINATGAKRVASFGNDDIYKMPVPSQSRSFVHENVHTELQLPSRVASGAAVPVSISHGPVGDFPVFTKGIHTLMLETTFRAPNKRPVTSRRPVRMAPPLLAPSTVETVAVETTAPKAAGRYAVTATVVDDKGVEWKRVESVVDVVVGKPLPGQGPSGDPSCSIELLSSHALPGGGQRVLARYSTSGGGISGHGSSIKINISEKGAMEAKPIHSIDMPYTIAIGSGVLFSIEMRSASREWLFSTNYQGRDVACRVSR